MISRLSLPVRILLLLSPPAAVALYHQGHREVEVAAPPASKTAAGKKSSPGLPFQLVVHPLNSPRLLEVPGPHHPDSIEIVEGPDTVLMRRKLFGFRDHAWVEKEARAIETGMQDPRERHEKLLWFSESLSNILWTRDTLGMRQTLEDWVEQRPRSALAWQVLAMFYVKLAWEIRGIKYAKDVPEAAWKPFHALLAEAREAADASLRIDPDNPIPYITKVNVARADGTGREEMESLYRRGAAVAPWSYAIRLHKLNFLKPKWGGSLEEMYGFARGSLKDTLINPKFKLLLIDANEELLWEYDPRKDKAPTADQARMLAENDALWRSLALRFPDDLDLQIGYVMFTHAYYLDGPFLEQMSRVGNRWKATEKWKTLDKYIGACTNMYFNAGKKAPTAKALAYFERAIALNNDPRWVNANWQLGLRLLSIGEYGEAERQFKIVLAGKPSYACEALVYLSLLNAQCKRDTAEAIRYAREIFKDMPVDEAREWAVEYLQRLKATPEG